jgi:hypothetical protein
MIISFKHNYIYFRPKKTGSSTIETVLSADLGPDDIIPGRKGAARAGRAGKPPESSAPLATHTQAEKIQAMVPEEFWQRCYKFASERHPYEKAVSLAFYRMHKFEKWGVEEADREFRRVLDEVVRGNSYSGLKYYSIEGAPVVDDFIRHESFEADLRRVAARVGVTVPEDLPRKKGSIRLDPRPAREILSDEQKRTIYHRCKQEFELLGYEP